MKSAIKSSLDEPLVGIQVLEYISGMKNKPKIVCCVFSCSSHKGHSYVEVEIQSIGIHFQMLLEESSLQGKI